MPKQQVIAIFDIGKTNKKLFLFDEDYQIVFERTAQFVDILDEDGEACENLNSLRLFILDSLREVFKSPDFEVKALNFSAYGASLVYLNEEMQTFLPLYNYLKNYPVNLKEQFYDTYGGEETLSFETASPVLGSLNSGMQLYRIKYEKPELFNRIKYVLHLPQYVSFLITGEVYSDITSLGCHTLLWDFQNNTYHFWVEQERLLEKLPPILPNNQVMPILFAGKYFLAGIGVHDSSAALIPYLLAFPEPFILLSTGTWCISLNPFNHSPLSKDELENDCLCYLSYEGKPVKASRLFAGYEHEIQVKRICHFFDQKAQRYETMKFNPEIVARLTNSENPQGMNIPGKTSLKRSVFETRNVADFKNDEEAYHQLIQDLVYEQFFAAQRVIEGPVKRIFVDGGFSKNEIYMNFLARAFPGMEVYAASIAQASALGAALSIHEAWNKKKIPADIIELKHFASEK